MTGMAIELSIIIPAFLAGLLVLSTHVPLGQQVLRRGIIFIDLAIAQIAGLGVIFAHLMAWEHNVWMIQLTAVGMAVLGGLLLTWTERRWPDIQEAIIGTVFVLAATGGILMLAHDPHGGEHLSELLVGQILWVDYLQLWPAATVSAAVLILWHGLRRQAQGAGFYLLFAFAVTVSVQLVGVYLVFASLIIPALASRKYTGRKRSAAAYGLGAAGYAAGLVLSMLFDLPPGAVIVWALAVAGIAVHAMAPGRVNGNSGS
jgi:zinc/manganese transport system permease protein